MNFRILLTIAFFLACPFLTRAQDEMMEVDTLGTFIGAETKGIYIGGGTAFIAGTGLGFLVKSITESGEEAGLPFIVGTWAVAPGSLIGLGLSALLGKRHDTINRSFAVSAGLANAPSFHPLDDSGRRMGIHLGILSPEIGRWRYKLSFEHYFSMEFVQFDEPAKITWWDVNMDLQYLIRPGQNWTIYPFIGSQLFYTEETASDSFGIRYSDVYGKAGANFGLGLAYSPFRRWSIFAETKWTANNDDKRTFLILSIQYYLR